MSELKIEQLESAETTTNVAAKVKKELTAEDIAALNAATEKIQEFGVSDNFAKVLPLVSVWHDKELAAPVKEEVIAAFGGSEKFKDYIGAEFSTELAVIAGIQKSVSVLNNVKSFYARRGDGTPKAKKEKLMQITIGGEPYSISIAYYESLASVTDKVEKKELILAHPLTKKNEAVEVL